MIQPFTVPLVQSIEDCKPLSEYFCCTVAKAQEGLMVKGKNSIYIPGKRAQWHKVFDL